MLPKLDTPVAALWAEFGSPAPPGLEPSSVMDGICGLCRNAPGAYKVSAIVSDNSTIWDDFGQQEGSAPRLCAGCSWAFRAQNGRKNSYLVTRSSAREIAFFEAARLIKSPLPSTSALSAPITARKHTLPYLGWGEISTDVQYHLSWGRDEAHLACAVWDLRKAGTPWVNIENAQPTLGTGTVTDKTFQNWDAIKSWKGSPHLKFATSLMRKSGLSSEETRV